VRLQQRLPRAHPEVVYSVESCLERRKLSTGVPRSQENARPWDPTGVLCLGSYGGPRGGGRFLMIKVALQSGGSRLEGEPDLVRPACVFRSSQETD